MQQYDVLKPRFSGKQMTCQVPPWGPYLAQDTVDIHECPRALVTARHRLEGRTHHDIQARHLQAENRGPTECVTTSWRISTCKALQQLSWKPTSVCAQLSQSLSWVQCRCKHRYVIIRRIVMHQAQESCG